MKSRLDQQLNISPFLFFSLLQDRENRKLRLASFGHYVFTTASNNTVSRLKAVAILVILTYCAEPGPEKRFISISLEICFRETTDHGHVSKQQAPFFFFFFFFSTACCWSGIAFFYTPLLGSYMFLVISQFKSPNCRSAKEAGGLRGEEKEQTCPQFPISFDIYKVEKVRHSVHVNTQNHLVCV